MAEDEKLTEKTENVAPALTDLIEIVDDPGGAALSQKMTVSNLLNSGLITVVGTMVTGDATAIVDAATTGAAGKVELTTAAEVSGGTDPDRAVTSDALAGSDFGIRSAFLEPIGKNTIHAAGDNKDEWQTPEWLDGWNLVDVRIYTPTAGTVGGLFSVMIHNLTQAADMLSTVCSVDPTEKTSDDATTPVVIDTAEDDITLGDVLRIDFDAVHDTPGAGCKLELVFQMP